MAAVTRRQYKGAAAQTTITNALASGDTSATLAATTGWPSGAEPFFVVISPGTASEEKCSATISGSVLTLTRAQDDTTAQSHASGATIYPVFTADDADEANKLASTLTTRGDLLTMDSGPDFKRLAVGSANTVLKSDGSDVAWGSITGSNISSATITGSNISSATVTGDKLANLTINDQTTSYTLVVGDRNKRVIMNSAGATTLTVPNGIFSAGDVIFIANKGAGTSTVTAGAGVTLNGSGTALAQHGGGTLLALSASTFTFFPAGGGVTALTVEFLLVGGGGGGFYPYCGGGGGGGMKTGSGLIGKSTYTVTVGAGGANARNGTASSFLQSANGGGAAGSGANAGQIGGSGGGAGYSGSSSPGQGISGEGNSGGSGSGSGTGAGGGGGGKGGVGGNQSGNVTGGAGGAGATNDYDGTSTVYSAGGGGGGATAGGAAGDASAGAGSTGATAGGNGAANRGGGGGGSTTGTGGSGGSGVVIVRWLTADATGFSFSATGTTSATPTVNGLYSWYKWTSSGTLVVS